MEATFPQTSYPTPAATPPNEAADYLQGGPDEVVLTSSRAVIDGQITPATLFISPLSGKIISVRKEVLPRSHFGPGVFYQDHTPHILLPGLCDSHVHFNEPGRTAWEGFWTGTRAAASGGVTTVVDMPLNSIPPTTTVENLKAKVQAARGKCWIDVGFYGGLVPGNDVELKALVREGVRGFKGFLIDSGVDEFPAITSADIEKAFRALGNEPTTVMFHAEMAPKDDELDQAELSNQRPGSPRSYQSFLSSRPPSYETRAIREILSLAHLAPNLPLHIVHLSAMESIPMLREARSKGVNITAETCFHYLSLVAEEVARGDTRCKCCPPIRDRNNQDELWRELLREPKDTNSALKTVVSDHSPCTPELKLLSLNEQCEDPGNFLDAWGGVSSIGLGISVLWTEGKKRGMNLIDLVRWCSENTSRQVGLEHRKGSLSVGKDADVVVFDEMAEHMVSDLLFKNKVSPYEQMALSGVVKQTWLRGRKVYAEGAHFDEKTGPTGQLLLERRKTR